MRRGDPRAGFTLIEVLAALVVTGAVVAVVLPLAGRLAARWGRGEATVEAADGWMQAIGRIGDDLAQAIPYGLGPGDGGGGAAFRAGADAVAFVRPALGGAGGLETVRYEIRASPAGSALVRRSRPFDPEAFDRELGGATATLLDGPFRLRLVELAPDGTRRRDWAPADGMPVAVELSAAPAKAGAGVPMPAGPVLLPIAARAPAVARKAEAAGSP